MKPTHFFICPQQPKFKNRSKLMTLLDLLVSGNSGNSLAFVLPIPVHNCRVPKTHYCFCFPKKI